jgi:hypothetical protein
MKIKIMIYEYIKLNFNAEAKVLDGPNGVELIIIGGNAD